MRVRAQTASGDYKFGQSAADFLVNSPAAVAQRIDTRLLLMRGEWFLDVESGTPWSTEILGAHTKPFYDLAIQERVLRTDGVIGINNYDSSLDDITRGLTLSMRVRTAFGEVQIQRAF